MSAVVIGLVGAGVGALAGTERRRFLGGLTTVVLIGAALAFFVTHPATFGATLLAAVAALGAWSVLPAEHRRQQVLAGGAAGFLCAAAAPHVGAFLLDQGPTFAQWQMLARPIVTVGAAIVGAGLAGVGGAVFAVLMCGFGLGLLEPTALAGWMTAIAAAGAATIARRSVLATALPLGLIVQLTVLEG